MERDKDAKLASIVGLLGNVFLFIIKIIVGFFTKSQAMIADAFNSLSDMVSSVISYVGNKIASKGADDDHNLGHGKAEYICSLLISLIMCLLGLKIFSSSIKAIFLKSEFKYSIWLIIVCIITIVVKFLMYLYTNKIAVKYNNLLVFANSKDHRNDIFLTIITLLSAIMSGFGFYFVDSLGGIIISIWIIYTGIMIFKESYDVLMDKTISLETKDKVLDIISNYNEIKKIQHFNATPVGYKYQVSFTIFVDGNLSTFESHDIANKLEKEIIKKIDEIYLVVIHVNPLNLDKNKKEKGKKN